MSEQVIHREPIVIEDQDVTPARRRTSQTSKNALIAASVTLVGAVAAAVVAGGSKQVEGKPMPGNGFAPDSGDKSTSSTQAPAPPSKSPEAIAPHNLDLNAPIPDSEVEKLFNLPPDTLEAEWDVMGPSTDPAPAGVPVPVHSRILQTPDHYVTVTVYQDQSYADAVAKLGAPVKEFPSQDGLKILSIPRLKTLETTFNYDGHNYSVDVASNVDASATADFLEEVVEDMTGSHGQ